MCCIGDDPGREAWRQKFPTIIGVILSLVEMLLTMAILGCEVGISVVQFLRMNIFVGYWTFPSFMCAWISLAGVSCCCRSRCCGTTTLVFQIIAIPFALCVIAFDAYFINNPTLCFFSSSCTSNSAYSYQDYYSTSANSTLYGVKVPLVKGQLAAGVLMLVACILFIVIYIVTVYRSRKANHSYIDKSSVVSHIAPSVRIYGNRTDPNDVSQSLYSRADTQSFNRSAKSTVSLNSVKNQMICPNCRTRFKVAA